MGEVASIGRSDIKPIVQGGSRDEQVMGVRFGARSLQGSPERSIAASYGEVEIDDLHAGDELLDPE
jgi:hypothetical protein